MKDNIQNEMMTSSFIEKFIDTASRNADKPAIVDNGGKRCTTYGEFLNLARKVAAYIDTLEIEPQSFVVVKMPYCMEYMAADLGIWLSRQIAVPVGDKYPQTRLDYIVNHCDCRLTLTLETMEEVRNLQPAEDIIPKHTDNAMLLYTSGSTGNPKGALITFEAMDNGVPRPMAPGVPMDDIVFGGSAPLYFAFGNHIWNVLLAGGVLHMYSEDVKNNIPLMEDYIAEHGITMSQISPAALVLFHNKSRKLRYVITSGEKLSSQYSKDGYTLYNLYGQTETLHPIIVYKMPEHHMDIIPIGKCILGIEMMVADEKGNPLPQGQTGEMCLRGPLFKEYYKEPELTTQAYHNGWLHTKDLVYLDEHGDIIYVNRKDWMVKVNGQRVEPGEVETAMLHIEGVRSAIVKGFDNGEGSQYLCAYFIAEPDVDGEVIRTSLAACLPSYMVPSYYVRLETLPLNANGKVDRKNLQAPDTAALKTEYAAPATEAEAALCDAYSSVLGIDRIGVNDDFFVLGGDSIRVMKLQLQCPKLPLSSRIIYAYRTPRAIAAAIADNSVSITHGALQAKLTQTQLGIFTECIKRQGEAVYNNPFLFRLSEKLDVEMLANAIEVAVGAHPVLNATIAMSDEHEPMMNMKAWDEGVCVVEQTSEELLHDRLSQLKQPFDLHNDRLCRVRIIETEQWQYLFIDVHHIIFDGTSMHILLGDIDRAYRGETVETENYTAFDIATDEEKERKGANYVKAKEWYGDAFGASLEVSMPLPDRYDEVKEEFRHDVFALDMGAAQLNEWCSKHDVTANMLTTLAFGKTLSAFTMTDKAVFATIYNGRSNIMTAKTMAMLVKTLPVVIDFAKNDSVAAMLAELKLQMLGAMANDIYSFAELATETGITSEVVFAYQADMHQVGSVGSAKLVDMKLDFNATGEPFLCQLLTNADNQLTLDMQYRSDKYSADFVHSFSEAYCHILGELCRKTTMAEVTSCSEEMLQKLDSFNIHDNDDCCDDDETVLSLFQKAARQYPDNVAAVFKDKKYTYRELDELTDKIGALIYNKVQKGLKGSSGVEPVVSILIPRNEYMFILPLSAMKAGCAYQPLDPSYPQERLNFMVKDADAALLIADPELRPIVNEYEGETLLTDNLEPSFNTQHSTSNIHHSSLFILLYTSGSTGVPKGVMLEHQNLVAFIRWYRRYYNLKPEHNVAAYASFGFDANMMDMYPALTTGATLHIIPEELRLDLVALNEYFEANGITHSFFTTQVGVQFLQNIDNHSLLHLSVGGEKLVSVNPAEHYTFHNGYGPTECTIFTTTMPVLKKEANIPIGKPTDGMECYVMDKNLHRLPVGAAGELVAVGKQVGRGYLNRPDITAASFFTYNGKRAYHTGDIVRYREDGNIEYVGRKDGQVKVRGFRIELKEVEAVIRSFRGVNDVTVQAFDDPNGGKFIAAYVVMNSSTSPVQHSNSKSLDIEALRQFILERKPPYMVPAVIMQIGKIPLNVNQKVNKKALPEPHLADNGTQEDYAPLNGEIEKTIARCIAETLAVDVSTISAHDTFTSIGGTSVKAISLMLLLKKNGIELSIDHLLKHNNIRILALIADYARRGEYVVKRTALLPVQSRMLQEHLHHPDRLMNTEVALLDIDATITEEHLRHAIDAVAKRYPLMTSAIAYIGVDMPMQVCLDRKVPLLVIDAETETDAAAMMMDYKHMQRQAVCFLQSQPLFRLTLFRVGGVAEYLMISYNAILAEDWKMRIWVIQLFEELREYGGESVENWRCILNAAMEAIEPSAKADWSKELNEDIHSAIDAGMDRRNDGADDNYKVLTETPGTKQLIFVHTGNTGSEAYQPLADALEGTCSFAVLDQWNLYHPEDRKYGITEIAKKYVEVLQAHHPHGPYYLGGWCYGGMIAYEMACQLTEMGERVEQLFIFDAFVVNQDQLKKMYLSQTGDNMRDYFERTPLFTGLVDRGLLDNLVSNSLQVNYDMTCFEPKQYAGNMLYFKAITPTLGISEHMNGFFETMNKRRAGGFEWYVPQQKLHIVDILQEHDNLMNKASLSIEVPVMKQYLQLI